MAAPRRGGFGPALACRPAGTGGRNRERDAGDRRGRKNNQ